MFQDFCRKILFGWMGWREEVTVEHRDKCIICVAPHTSNWDFIIAQLYYGAIGRRAGFLMKEEWFIGPLGWFFRKIGGIPVKRSKKTSLTDQVAAKAIAATKFEFAVTPEGTRSLTEKWKRGFYYIALKASLPIQLYAIDFKKKLIVCTKEIFPTGDIEAQMKEIMAYYKDFKGKYPHKFAIETIE